MRHRTNHTQCALYEMYIQQLRIYYSMSVDTLITTNTLIDRHAISVIRKKYLRCCGILVLMGGVLIVVGLTIEICSIGIDDHFGPWGLPLNICNIRCRLLTAVPSCFTC